MRTIPSISLATIIRPSGWRWRRLLLKLPFDCSRIPEKRISRAPDIFTGATSTMMVLWRSLKSRAKLCLTILAFSSSWDISGARQGHLEEGMQNLKRALELDPRNLLLLQQTALVYNRGGRYSEMAATLDRALAIAPNDSRGHRSNAPWWTSSGKRIRVRCTRRSSPFGPETRQHFRAWPIIGCSAHWLSGIPLPPQRRLAALGDGVFGSDAQQFSNSFGTGLVARMTNDTDKAHAAFTAARTAQEKIVQAQPGYGPGALRPGRDRRRAWTKRGRAARRPACARASSRGKRFY